MPHLIGPDFIGIQMDDLDAARIFYSEVVGLTIAATSPPGAVVFDTKPIPFAVRRPIAPLTGTDNLGEGIALWFACDDADALHAHLVDRGITILFPPKEGPFGRYFSFRDPFGYAMTCHTLTQ